MFLFFVLFTGCVSLSRAEHGQGYEQCMSETDKTASAYKDRMKAIGSNNLYSLWMTNVKNKPRVFRREDLKALHLAASTHEITGLSDATLWYVGGHRECYVGQQIINASHGSFSSLIVFEPTPSFFKQLQRNLGNFNPDKLKKKVLNNYGLSNKDFTIKSPVSGASTSSRKGKDACKLKGKCEKLKIRETLTALKENGFDLLKNKDNMLYTNCEGCEIDVMKILLDADLVKYFAVIHLATHFLKDEEMLYARAHCEIVERLEATHRRVFGIMFAQERWVRRD